MKILGAIAGLSIVCLAASCDPVHDISIVNETRDVAVVRGHATTDFQPRSSDSVTSLSDSSGAREVQFSIPPGGEFKCGSAIASVDNDLPFRDVVIRFGTDSLVARNELEVKGLFDKGTFGVIAKPYRITLKSDK